MNELQRMVWKKRYIAQNIFPAEKSIHIVEQSVKVGPRDVRVNSSYAQC